MQFDPKQLATKVQGGLKANSTRYLNERVKWMRADPVGMRLEALVSIQRGDWTALGQLASTRRRRALREMTAIKRQRKSLRRLALDIARLSDVVRVRDHWTRPNQRPD